MSTKFAKLIETEIGQVLALKDISGDCPVLRIIFDSGVPMIAMSEIELKFELEPNLDKFNAAFDAMTDEDLFNIAKQGFWGVAELNNVFEQNADN